MRKKPKISFFQSKIASNPLHLFLLGSVVGFMAAMVSKDELFSGSTALSRAQAPIKQEEKNPFPFLAPATSPIIKRVGYSMAYDGKNRAPGWVFEHLNEEKLQGEAEIHRYKFHEDDELPKHLRSTLDDYYGSGFERAHLCPAKDQTTSSKAMYETFLLSNASPIEPKLAKGYMDRLERQIRLWTSKFKNLYVLTGPLYLSSKEADGNEYIKYRVIGPNHVAVPTHFYKVVLVEKASGEYETKGFIIPNREIKIDTSLSHYLASVEKIETLSGYEFFKGLSNGENIKASDTENLW